MLIACSSKKMEDKLEVSQVPKQYFTFLSEQEKDQKPLNGINMDIKHLKQYGVQKIFQSSTDKKKWINRQFLEEQLRLFFSKQQEAEIPILYFTGHGQQNGDLVLETDDHPEGQRLKMRKIVDLWRKRHQNGSCNAIFMYFDSCQSGKLLQSAQDIIFQEDQEVQMYSSSGLKQKSGCTDKLGSYMIWLITHKKKRKEVPQLYEYMLSQFFKAKPMIFEKQQGKFQGKKRYLKRGDRPWC